MLSIAERCNPTLSGCVRVGKDAWQHLASNILTPEMGKALSKNVCVGKRPVAHLLISFRERGCSKGWFDDFENHHLQLLVLLEDWFLKACGIENFHCFDWRLLDLADLGEEFLEARKQALLANEPDFWFNQLLP